MLHPTTVKKIWALTGAAVVTFAVLLYYMHLWRNIPQFIEAIDHCDVLFGDFEGFFYTTGGQILSWGQPVRGFFYSAFAALLFYPIGQLSPEWADLCWLVCQIVFAVALCFVANALATRDRDEGLVLSAFLTIIAFPLLHNFLWGQVSVVLVLLVVLSFLAYQRDRCVAAAVLLAVAASIKYYPGLFAVYYLLRWDFRSFGIFLLTVIMCFFLLPVALLGWPEWLAFHEQSNAAFSNIDWVAWDSNSQYIRFVVPHMLQIGVTAPLGRSLIALGVAVAIANMVLLWVIQKTEVEDRVALSAVCLFLTLPFVVVTSWPHYFTYLPFCQLAMFAALCQLWQRRRNIAMLLYGVCSVSVVLSSTFLFNQFPGHVAYNNEGMPFLSNALLLVALYALIGFSERRQDWLKDFYSVMHSGHPADHA